MGGERRGYWLGKRNWKETRTTGLADLQGREKKGGGRFKQRGVEKRSTTNNNEVEKIGTHGGFC